MKSSCRSFHHLHLRRFLHVKMSSAWKGLRRWRSAFIRFDRWKRKQLATRRYQERKQVCFPLHWASDECLGKKKNFSRLSLLFSPEKYLFSIKGWNAILMKNVIFISRTFRCEDLMRLGSRGEFCNIFPEYLFRMWTNNRSMRNATSKLKCVCAQASFFSTLLHNSPKKQF